MGDIDELNSHVGLVCAQLKHNKGQSIEKEFSEALVIIQHLLFNIGGELAMPEYEGVNATHIEWLEQQIDMMNATLPPPTINKPAESQSSSTANTQAAAEPSKPATPKAVPKDETIDMVIIEDNSATY